VVNLGLIDTSQRSREAGHQCREDIDVLFLYVTTYALFRIRSPPSGSVFHRRSYIRTSSERSMRSSSSTIADKTSRHRNEQHS